MNDFKSCVDKIFKIIEASKRVLIPLHLNPDGDSVASSLAFAHVLKNLGKEVVISSTDPVPDFGFLHGVELVQKKDLADFDLGKFDLLLLLDPSCSPAGIFPRITRETIHLPKGLSVVLIDHHPHSEKYSKFSAVLIGEQAASTTELLYKIFDLKNINVDKDLATLLMVGLVTDNGFFRFPNTTASTFEVASRLMKRGVDYNDVIFNLLRQVPKEYMKLWSLILGNIEVANESRFLLSAISYDELQELGFPASLISPARGSALAMFFQQVKGTEFGVLLTEEEPGQVSGSLRSRTGFDVSKIARELGGGGHKLAAGFNLEMDIEKAKEKVLEVARHYIN